MILTTLAAHTARAAATHSGIKIGGGGFFSLRNLVLKVESVAQRTSEVIETADKAINGAEVILKAGEKLFSDASRLESETVTDAKRLEAEAEAAKKLTDQLEQEVSTEGFKAAIEEEFVMIANEAKPAEVTSTATSQTTSTVTTSTADSEAKKTEILNKGKAHLASYQNQHFFAANKNVRDANAEKEAPKLQRTNSSPSLR